jgi:ribosomal protein L12E/L44/L45/RPP1/RPP2
VALAERISGQQLDELFNTWLFTAGRPALSPAAAAATAAAGAPDRTPPVVASLLDRLSKGALRLRR